MNLFWHQMAQTFFFFVLEISRYFHWSEKKQEKDKSNSMDGHFQSFTFQLISSQQKTFISSQCCEEKITNKMHTTIAWRMVRLYSTIILYNFEWTFVFDWSRLMKKQNMESRLNSMNKDYMFPFHFSQSILDNTSEKQFRIQHYFLMVS